MRKIEDRIWKQLEFIVEVDRLKTVLRRSLITDKSRPENTAEHCWHIALAAVVLFEHAEPGVQLWRVISMLLIHDLVEIDAGDTFLYGDHASKSDQQVREQQAAERIFGLLPEDQCKQLRLLWDEFEAGESADAQFARCIDRLQPLLLDHKTEGSCWKPHNVSFEQVIDQNSAIKEAAPRLWEAALTILHECRSKGFLRG